VAGLTVAQFDLLPTTFPSALRGLDTRSARWLH
jgi:hypothetical protein